MKMTVTILILIDGFLQYKNCSDWEKGQKVTILILIDGFLQLSKKQIIQEIYTSHNPYFNRWFSAMEVIKIKNINTFKSQSLF